MKFGVWWSKHFGEKHPNWKEGQNESAAAVKLEEMVREAVGIMYYVGVSLAQTIAIDLNCYRICQLSGR